MVDYPRDISNMPIESYWILLNMEHVPFQNVVPNGEARSSSPSCPVAWLSVLCSGFVSPVIQAGNSTPWKCFFLFFCLFFFIILIIFYFPMKVSRRLNAIVKSCKHWPGAVPMPHLIPRGARILTLDICGSGKWQGHPLGRSVVVESVDWILSVGKKPVFRWCWTSKISSIGRSSRAPLIFLGLKKKSSFCGFFQT